MKGTYKYAPSLLLVKHSRGVDYL